MPLLLFPPFRSDFHHLSFFDVEPLSGVMALGASYAMKASDWLIWSTLLAITTARSICGILDQRTAIVGDRLFWSSGNYTFDDDISSWSNTSSLYWLRLNDTINVHGPIDMSLVGSVALPSDALTGGTSPMSGGAAGTFFYDHTMLYAYAGMVGPEANGGVDNQLWAFNTTTDEWRLVPVAGGRIAFGNNSEGVHATDARTGTSFYTGGWEMAFNGSNNGTVKFESDNSGTGDPQWSFMTAQHGEQGPSIVKGAMVYVRAGQAGVLVAFGGYNTAYEGSQFAQGWDWDQRNFSSIYLYDIFSNTWYHQTATGDIPAMRSEFCVGVSSASDDSSGFQITVTGGWDQFYERAFNDVYVLSLPSFHWIRISDSNNPDTAVQPAPGRNRHKCDMWRDAQMIAMGGLATLGQGTSQHLNDVCNETYPPVRVLDTSTYTWRTQFVPGLECSVPDAVTAVIGGNSTGGAVLSSPAAGWGSDELSTIFSKRVQRDIDDGTLTGSAQTSATNTGGSNASSDGSGGQLSGGAVAGIVIGSITAFVFIIVAVLWWRRRRRARLTKKLAAEREMVDGAWQKPELETREQRRQELDMRTQVHETHGDAVAIRPVELPVHTRPSEMPG